MVAREHVQLSTIFTLLISDDAHNVENLVAHSRSLAFDLLETRHASHDVGGKCFWNKFGLKLNLHCCVLKSVKLFHVKGWKSEI